MNSRYKQLIRDIGIFALGALGSKLIAFLLLPLYTNILSTEEYGIADLIFTLGQLLLPVFSLAVFNGLLRYGLMKDVKAEDALCCATRVFVIGSIVAIFVTPLLRFIPSVSEWRWYLCAYVISSFAFTNSLVYLKVKDKNTLYAVLSVVQTLSLVACNLAFLVGLDLGVRGYLLSYIISNALTVFCAMMIGGMIKDFRNASYHSDLMKLMVLFSLPYILNDISWWAIHSSNKLMIEFMIGSAVLGIYTTASKVPSLINVVASIFTQAWGLSSIKEYDSSNDTNFYSKVFNYFVIVIFGACIGVISIIKIFMRIYVSDEFFGSWQFVPLLLFGAVFSALSSFSGSLLGAMKKPRNLMWSTLVAGTANVVLNIVLIPVYGLWGAAVGTLVANCIVAVFRLISVKKHLKIDYGIRRNVPIVFVAFTHMVLVSMDFYIVIVSAVAVMLYITLIFNDVKLFRQMIRKTLKR